MANMIGQRGQVVIDKLLRDQLGIGPGWQALQEVEEGRLVMRFVPPLHSDSLAGVCSRYGRPELTPEEREQLEDEGIAASWAGARK